MTDDLPSTSFDDLPEDLLGLVKPELQPGERLLWASKAGGRSRNSGRVSRPVLLTWAIGLLAIGVLSFGGLVRFGGVRHPEMESALLVLGIVTIPFGMLLLLGIAFSFVARGAQGSRQVGGIYALTDRRAIIWTPLPHSTALAIRTFAAGTIKSAHLHRVQYPDGSGDVIFQRPFTYPAGFVDVVDVRRVETLIRGHLLADTAESHP